MARVNYGNYKVLNPTPFDVIAGFDRMSKTGAEYTFKPFEEKEIFVLDHVEHICSSKEKEGLVRLNYNDGAKQVYETYEDYKIARSIEGINACLNKWKEALMYEEAFIGAAKARGNEIELRTSKLDDIQSNITDLEDLLKKLKQPRKKVIPKEKPIAPEWMTAEKNDIKVKKTSNGRIMIDEGEGFKFASKEKLEKLNVDISTDADRGVLSPE